MFSVHGMIVVFSKPLKSVLVFRFVWKYRFSTKDIARLLNIGIRLILMFLNKTDWNWSNKFIRVKMRFSWFSMNKLIIDIIRVFITIIFKGSLNASLWWWWLKVDDDFRLLVTGFRCWWHLWNVYAGRYVPGKKIVDVGDLRSLIWID